MLFKKPNPFNASFILLESERNLLFLRIRLEAGEGKKREANEFIRVSHASHCVQPCQQQRGRLFCHGMAANPESVFKHALRHSLGEKSNQAFAVTDRGATVCLINVGRRRFIFFSLLFLSWVGGKKTVLLHMEGCFFVSTL